MVSRSRVPLLDLEHFWADGRHRIAVSGDGSMQAATAIKRSSPTSRIVGRGQPQYPLIPTSGRVAGRGGRMRRSRVHHPQFCPVRLRRSRRKVPLPDSCPGVRPWLWAGWSARQAAQPATHRNRLPAIQMAARRHGVGPPRQGGHPLDTPAPTEPPVQLFSTWLAEQRKGSLDAELSMALAELVAGDIAADLEAKNYTVVNRRSFVTVRVRTVGCGRCGDSGRDESGLACRYCDSIPQVAAALQEIRPAVSTISLSPRTGSDCSATAAPYSMAHYPRCSPGSTREGTSQHEHAHLRPRPDARVVHAVPTPLQLL